MITIWVKQNELKTFDIITTWSGITIIIIIIISSSCRSTGEHPWWRLVYSLSIITTSSPLTVHKQREARLKSILWSSSGPPSYTSSLSSSQGRLFNHSAGCLQSTDSKWFFKTIQSRQRDLPFPGWSSTKERLERRQSKNNFNGEENSLPG